MGNKGRSSASKQPTGGSSPSSSRSGAQRNRNRKHHSDEQLSRASLLTVEQALAGTDAHDNDDQAAETEEEEEEEEDDEEGSRKNAGHPGWFQQHCAWLHHHAQTRQPATREEPAREEATPATPVKSKQEPRNQRALITRWTNLVLTRTFGVSVSGSSQLATRCKAPEQTQTIKDLSRRHVEPQRLPVDDNDGRTANRSFGSRQHLAAKATSNKEDKRSENLGQHSVAADRQAADTASCLVRQAEQLLLEANRMDREQVAAGAPMDRGQTGRQSDRQHLQQMMNRTDAGRSDRTEDKQLSANMETPSRQRLAAERRPRGWFMKSLSNSTSTLLAPLQQRTGQPKGGQSELAKPEQRSKSSCEQTSEKVIHSSPYRQIARVLRLSQPKEQQRSQRLPGNQSELEAPPGKSQQTAASKTKKRRLVQQPAHQDRSSAPADAPKSETDGTRGMRLGKPLFGFASPLFRRNQTRSSCGASDTPQPTTMTTTSTKKHLDEQEDDKGAVRRAGSAKKKIRQEEQRERAANQEERDEAREQVKKGGSIINDKRGNDDNLPQTSGGRKQRKPPAREASQRALVEGGQLEEVLPLQTAPSKTMPITSNGAADTPTYRCDATGNEDWVPYANEEEQPSPESGAHAWKLVAAATIRSDLAGSSGGKTEKRRSLRRLSGKRPIRGADEDPQASDDRSAAQRQTLGNLLDRASRAGGVEQKRLPASDDKENRQQLVAACSNAPPEKGYAKTNSGGPLERRFDTPKRLDDDGKQVSGDFAGTNSVGAAQAAGGSGKQRVSTNQELEVKNKSAFVLPLIQPLASSTSVSLSTSATSSMSSLSGSASSSSAGYSPAKSCSSSSRLSGSLVNISKVPKSYGGDEAGRVKRRSSKSSRKQYKPPAASGLIAKPAETSGQQAANQTSSSGCPPVVASTKQQQKKEETGTQKANPSGVGILKSNFKKLVKRQQSVDSYRMARDLKNKQRRQQEEENQSHQSNETAMKAAKSVGARPLSRTGRKFSMRTSPGSRPLDPSGALKTTPLSWIRIELMSDGCSDSHKEGDKGTGEKDNQRSADSQAKKQAPSPTPPSSLSLMPSSAGFVVGSFAGYITPTYPTHHLPSPKYVSAAMASKKYSNASSISSSLAGDTSLGVSLLGSRNPSCTENTLPVLSASRLGSHSDTDNSLAGSASERSPSSSPMNLSGLGVAASSAANHSQPQAAQVGSGQPVGSAQIDAKAQKNNDTGQQPSRGTDLVPRNQANGQANKSTNVAGPEEDSAAAAAARRAQLAEHIYDNKCGLGEDMKFLASLPELCDITFLVGETREPVCAVKSVLAARSRVFHKILFGNQRSTTGPEEVGAARRAGPLRADSRTPSIAVDRRGSSPKPGRTLGKRHSQLSSNKSTSPPLGRSPSPQQQQQQQQQWSVTTASGYSPAPSSSNLPVDGEGSSPTMDKQSGRTSVTGRSGRDSVNQLSWQSSGSQQPLVIGPGQTAAPAKRNKKSSIRDSRLSRMFMSSSRRASDPSIKHHHPANLSNQSYLEKMSSSQMSTTMIIEEFEPDVFRQLIEYIHTGCVLLQARTLLGLLNAADYYGLEQLRKACLRFVSCCITVDTVCSLLSTAERYIQYKCTKSIVQKVLEFVDTHADEIFKLNAFGLLPEHVVRLILARDGLKADEEVKYMGVHTWCEHYCRSYELTNIADVMRNFLDLIQFHKIPTNVLLSEIYPTHIVPDHIFLSALAYQADPQNFEPQPSKTRRMTLPNPSIHKDYEPDAYEQLNGESQIVDMKAGASAATEPQSRQRTRIEAQRSAGTKRDLAKKKRKSSEEQQAQVKKLPDHLFGSQDLEAARHTARAGRLRKGSIAQVSLSGVLKLSHKLSIKKKQLSTGSSGSELVGKQRASKRQSVRQQQLQHQHRQQSDQKDPMQVGQQILEAYLVDQRQRELEEAEQRRRQAAEEEAKRRASREQAAELAASLGLSPQPDMPLARHGNNKPQQQQQQRQPISKVSASRKSFKDFKHISRRIFMRHPSGSKMPLQQQHSSASSSSFSAISPLLTGAVMNPSSTQTSQQTGPPTTVVASGSLGLKPTDKDRDKDKRRSVLKIRRSETVFETAGISSSTAQDRRLLQQLSANLPAK